MLLSRGKTGRDWRLRGLALAVGVCVIGLAAATASATQMHPRAVAPQINRNATISAGYALGAIYSLDPVFNPIGTYAFEAPLYDSLVTIAPNYSKVYPSLATSWAYSRNGRALTFQLREGVVFHDGSPVDAQAVKDNILRYKTLPGSLWAADLAPISSVKVVGKYTVQLNLAPGQGQGLPELLAQGPGMIVNPKDFNANLATDPPASAGSGPYVFSSKPNALEVVLTRYSGPHGTIWEPGAGDAKQLDLYVVSDAGATTIDDIKSGQLNVGLVDASGIASALALIKAQPQKYAGQAVAAPQIAGHLFLNPKIPPFDNILLRKAVQAAINPLALARAISPGGYCATDYQPVSPWDPTFNHHFVNSNPYSPTKVKQYLSEAGMPNGFSFTMDTPGFTVDPAQAAEIQAALEPFGIKATINTISPATSTSDENGGHWQAFAGAIVATPTLVDGVFNRVLTEGTGPGLTVGTPLQAKAESYLGELSNPTLSTKAFIADAHSLYDWMNNEAISLSYCADEILFLGDKNVINTGPTMPSGQFDAAYYGELK